MISKCTTPFGTKVIRKSCHQLVSHFFRITWWDPAFPPCSKMWSLNITQLGRHTLETGRPYLLYLPHAPKQLYESILSTNYAPSLCGNKPGRILLGNDLAEYLPGFVRPSQKKEPSGEADGDGEFVKPKKKRRGRGEVKPQIKDGVLSRVGESHSALLR